MRVTKRQLRRIIKEEKGKLREQPQSPGERARWLYADDFLANQAGDFLHQMYDQMTEEAQADGVELEEAEDMAAEGLLTVVDDVLKRVGHLNVGMTLKGARGR